MSDSDDARRPDGKDVLKRGLRALGRRVGVVRGPQPPRPVGPPRVTFASGATVDVPTGSSLLVAARRAGVEISHYCGGMCSCGTCRVEVLEGPECLSAPEGREQMVLGSTAYKKGDRLACQAKVLGTVKIRVPEFF